VGYDSIIILTGVSPWLPTPYFVWTVPAWFAWYLYATRAKGKAGGEDFAVSRQ
jgi:hypothetical protein